ncbi:eukaryotic translation initiation factor 2 subunit 1, partial [Aphelenchoides avenae]
KHSNVSLSCRFYANEFPDLKDTVVVKVKEVTEAGAYITLPEYNNKEAMIPLAELSRRRIRSAKQLVRVGRNECVSVIRVDKDKGVIALSKRKVRSEEVPQCEERFARAKAINGILRGVAEHLGYETNEQLEELYDKTVWFFDRKAKKKTAAYDTFKKALTCVLANFNEPGSFKHFSDPTVFDECDISEAAKALLIEVIQKKHALQALKIRANIEVSCSDYDGVETVKMALAECKKFSTEEVPIKIQLYASPVYLLIAQTTDRIEGVDTVKKALNAIKNSIESFGGTFKIVMEPTPAVGVIHILDAE